MKIPIAFLTAFVLLLPVFVVAQTAPVLGQWDSTLTVERREGNPSYEVDFKVVVEAPNNGAGALRAKLINGSDSKPFSRVQWESGKLSLSLGEYEGELTLSCESPQCDRLEGSYTRLTRKGQVRYGVKARRHAATAKPQAAEWKWTSLAGDWVFTMSTPGSVKKDSAPARFEQSAARFTPSGANAEIEGTVAEVSGDYGMLHGEIVAEQSAGAQPRFRLSRFDGIHTTLVEGAILADGTLRGTIAFSAMSTAEFTASRKANAPKAAGNEAESLTRMKSPEEPFRFTGVDVRSGKSVTEAEFSGKPLIIDVFGTWCPNCHDEAPLLRELYSRYHGQGLEIVGLSFEYTDDRVRNTRLIEFFRKKYGVEYPLLLAGTTDEAEKKLSQLEGFGAFPTTIIIDRKGRVRAVHAGFEGAATGQLDEVSRRFDELVREILKAE